MKILIVEDDEFKRHNVARVATSILPAAKIIYAESIVGSLTVLEENLDVSLVILDMSLPTYAVGPAESGGRPQGFGGLTVLQHLEALDISAPVIVVTQYSTFGEDDAALDLIGLEKMLNDEYSSLFQGLVRYSGGSDKWKEDLSNCLKAYKEL